ncbi:cytochrome P450 4C1-like isoform X2 [Convolutriloba macropyga]|uniref:cytochrome P450 4C1-like isoform X2 n=1 Tax=Convolutriloba macropyga TaxID=536237 RepID=UPI003F525DFC
MISYVFYALSAGIFLFTSWLFTTFLLCFYTPRRLRIRSAILKIPGLPLVPLLGNLLQLPKVQGELIRFLPKLGLNFSGMFYLMFGPEASVFVTKGTHAATVLKSSKHSEKSHHYKKIHIWLKTGLLTSNGEKWRNRRKMLTPAFHFDILDKSLVIMMKHTNVGLDLFTASAEKGDFVDIWEAMSMLALDIVCHAAMGVELGSQMQNPASLQYVQNRAAVTEILVERFRRPLLWNDFCYFNLIPSGRKCASIVRKLHQFTTDVITRRWSELQQEIAEGGNLGSLEGRKNRKRYSFLDLLLMAKQEHGLSFEDIREEVDTFMFEGHDTTAAAMSFVLQTLATRPDVMTKLQEEVDDKFANVALHEDNYQEVKKALNSMPYLDAVLKEGLRMYPSVPSIGRTLTEDVEINGYKLLSGTDLTLHIYSIHHDPDIYNEPYKFNPDRWVNNEVPIEEYPFCYIPFSAGPRNCIGQKFAQMEEKLIIASIVRHFDLESDTKPEDFSFFGQMILRPLKKFHIKFQKREVTN